MNPSPTMSIRRALAPALVLSLAILAACGQPPAAPPAGPPVVRIMTIQAEDIPVEKVLVGRSVTDISVDLQARVTGELVERPFIEGGMVKKGDVLFRIDPRQFQADLESSRAKLAQAEAKLAQAEVDLRRVEPLAKAGAAPQQDLDNARTALLSAQADVRAAQAAVANSALNLGYTTISAPFDGRAGKASVDPGAVVSPSIASLVTLDQVDPIAVEFTLSEVEILGVRREIEAGRMVTPGRDQLVVRATLLSGQVYPLDGTIAFADIRLRPETGTALLRARFPNPKGEISPGQFMRVAVVGMVRKAAVLVPQAAVAQGPSGASAYVVAADGVATQRQLVLGDWMGERWLIRDGLKAGDRVVVEGLQKVRAGSKVQASEASAEKPAAAAKPASAAAAH
jgi:membrane fusion protein (multidrug efflux system)